jgi:tetratricopeptide (TPR) repeat protein
LATCLPALLGMAAATTVAVTASMTDPAMLINRYGAEFERSRKAEQFGEARICAERLAVLETWAAKSQLRLVEAFYNEGNLKRAVGLVDTITLPDGTGYAPARLWKARYLLSRTPVTGEAIREAEKQARLALESQRDLTEAAVMLAEIYIQTGRLKQAEPLLRQVVVERPDLRLVLAAVHAGQGDAKSARQEATSALEHFKHQCQSRPDDELARLNYAAAAMLLKEWAQAEAILKEGLERSNTTAFHRAMADLFLKMYEDREREAAASFPDRLTLLQRGLAHDPENFGLVQHFSEIINAGGADGESARSALRALTVEGRAGPAVRFALGLDAWRQGHTGEAQLHWDQAYTMSPQTPILANNLAWVTAFGPSPNLEKALATIEPVVRSWPDDPRFRGTRGQILASLGRWKEALPDLQAALKAYGDRPDLNLALATTYDHLDAPGMAAEHRLRAEAGGKKARTGGADPGPPGFHVPN